MSVGSAGGKNHGTISYQIRSVKKCAAKRRGKPYNPLETVNGIRLTRYASKPLAKLAEKQTPKTFRDILASPSFLFITCGTWYLEYKFGPNILNVKEIWIQFPLLMLAVTVPIFLGIWVIGRLMLPRNKKVAARLSKLVRERQQAIEEAERFYTSPEWKTLRKKMLEQYGRGCVRCKRIIRRELDLTVDHIKPRSKFPTLALDPTNLQVMCRQCNSRKRDYFIGEMDVL